VFQKYIQRVIGAQPGHRMGRGAARLGSCQWGMLVLILAPGSCPRGERGGGQGKGAADVGQGEANGGGVCVRCRTRQTGKDCSDTVGVLRVSNGLSC
jgi:hypothetical protein